MPGFELSKECFSGIGAAYDTFRGLGKPQNCLTSIMQEQQQIEMRQQSQANMEGLERTARIY